MPTHVGGDASQPGVDRSGDPSDLILSPGEAFIELQRRRQDKSLIAKIEGYFSHDIPEYLKNEPVLYMARHIGTPNFEALRFISLVRELNLPIVISRDSKAQFVSQNHVKKALCKLPICTRISQKGGKLNEHYHNISVVDFNTSDGKLFTEMETVWGEKLVDFHLRMFSELGIEKVEFPDDSLWIDRHHRGNLLEHYKDLLSLFVAHGIFFENYNMSDPHEVAFVKEILRPACEEVKRRFGYYPLISPIFPMHFETFDFWISYPKEVLEIVRKSLDKPRLHEH